MIHIEDLIISAMHVKNLNKWDSQIVNSFVDQIYRGSSFTEKQSLLAVRILKKHVKELEVINRQALDNSLQNPSFRMGIRKINLSKRISIIDHPQWKRAIKVEFPYSLERVDLIRKNKDTLLLANWDGDQKAWLFCLSEASIKFLMGIIANEEFDLDEEFENYVQQIKDITNSIEMYVPMLFVDEGIPKFKNVSAFTPEIETDNILEAVFQARKLGIFTWDNAIDHFLENANLNNYIKSFLNDQSESLSIDSTKEPVEILADIVKYMQPSLFIIPGGSELPKTKMIYEFLKSQGYKNEEISVMFRLPSSQGRDFNEFVKNNNLNNPITEQTKFVFVSVKLPKPVIKSKMRFHSVISLGRSNVHYTIRDFFKNRQNLIYFCEPSKQKEFGFVYV